MHGQLTQEWIQCTEAVENGCTSVVLILMVICSFAMYAKTLFVRIMNACNRLLLVKLMSCLHDYHFKL